MTHSSARSATDGAAGNFSSTARDYDAGVRHNIQGAHRLVMSLPPGEYGRVLDVGCGTGWSSLAMVERFGCAHVTGVDPAHGMLEVFREKVSGLRGTTVDLRAEDVMAMSVPDGAYDAAISSMAMHWFPDKDGATRAMARALRPGGVLGILCSGRGGEDEYRAVLARIDLPGIAIWDAAFDDVQRDVPEMEGYLAGAGLDILDVWMERRIRRTPPEAYLERMRVVGGHILGGALDQGQVAELLDRVELEMRAASGARGFEYTFTKLFAVARRPG